MKRLLFLFAAVFSGLVAHAQAVIGLEDWKIYEESVYVNSVYLPQGDSAATVSAKYLYQKTSLPVPGVQQPVVSRNGRQALVMWTRTKGLPQSGIVQILVNGALRYAANVYVGKGPTFLINAQLPTRLSQFVNDLKLQTAADVQAIIGGKFNTADTSRLVQKVPGKTLSSNDYSSVEKFKLAGIQSGATLNSTDAQLRDRSTHTGQIPASVISDFVAAVRTSLSATGSGIAYNSATGLFTSTVISTTDASQLTSGKLDDGRLSANVLLASGSYDNPAWLTRLSVAKISGLATVATTGNFGDLNGRPTLGTMASQNAGAVAITGGSVYLPGFDLYNPQLRVGALEFQGANASTSYIAHNAHLDETDFKLRYAGPAGLLAFLPNEGQFRFAPSGIAGSYSLALATKSQMKIGADGSFGIGGVMPPEVGDYSGAALYVKGSSRNVLINTTVDEPSAILTISSSTQGVLLPSLTTSQINAISIPKKGLLVFNSDLPGFQYWTGSGWKSLLTN